MPYCSKACQIGDFNQHKMLCDQYKDFQDEHRPSPNHRRVIFFPHDEDRPRFAWLKYSGHPLCMRHDLDDLEKYIPGRPGAIGFFDAHRELRRQYQNTFWMQHHDVSFDLPVNTSLIPLLGSYAARWRGPVICMAPTKYKTLTEWHDYDEEDQDEDLADVLVPYDLDTSSLAIHVACLRFVAKYGYTGRAYCLEAEGVGDGFDPE